jgi:hypothetical protein
LNREEVPGADSEVPKLELAPVLPVVDGAALVELKAELGAALPPELDVAPPLEPEEPDPAAELPD